MSQSASPNTHTLATPTPSRRLWVLLGVAVVSATIVLRWLINFRYALAPATDGAYYPMQTWWLIEHGRLMYDDLPLIFWLNAGLTHLIAAISELPLDDSAVLASRLIDGATQPFVAAFILMLGYVWSAGRRTALLGCAAAALLAVSSPPIMRMASDFQKNSLGLVWMVCALWAVRWALSQPRRAGRWALLAMVVLLAALTHIGAFGVTCVMLITVGIAYGFTGDRVLLSRRGVWWLFISTVLGGALLFVAWCFEPTRTAAMLTAPWRLIHVTNLRPSPSILISVVVYGLLALVIRQLWRTRSTVPRCDRAVVMGAVAAVAILVFPFLPQDYAQRFLLMTPVPAAVLIAFIMAQRAVTGRALWPAKALAVVALLLALPAPWMMQGPTLTTAEADEIKSFRDLIPDPAHTLIVAPHGTQYWAGLLLHTPVRMGELPDDAFTRYSRVLILQPTTTSRGPSRQPPPRRESHRSGRDDPPGPPASRPHHAVTVPHGSTLIRSATYFNVYDIPSPRGARVKVER